MLGEICRTAPIDTNVADYKVDMQDPDAAARYMAKLELFSLIDKFNLGDAPKTEEKKKRVKKACCKIQLYC